MSVPEPKQFFTDPGRVLPERRESFAEPKISLPLRHGFAGLPENLWPELTCLSGLPRTGVPELPQHFLLLVKPLPERASFPGREKKGAKKALNSAAPANIASDVGTRDRRALEGIFTTARIMRESAESCKSVEGRIWTTWGGLCPVYDSDGACKASMLAALPWLMPPGTDAGPALEPQLKEDVLHMLFHRARAATQDLRDVSVAFSRGDPADDFALAWRQTLRLRPRYTVSQRIR
jgi:hypothetical protein